MVSSGVHPSSRFQKRNLNQLLKDRAGIHTYVSKGGGGGLLFL